MADVVVGARLQLDANDGIKSLKEFKQQLKEAQGDVVAMSEKFGATSVQAREAAKRAAELSDAIADAKSLTDSFNPDKKFVALGQSLNGVLGGFTALTGAMGLLGVESEEVQKQLLKVQSALALSQGLNQIGDSIQSFKNLGQTLVNTLGRNGLIGVAIAGVGALALAFSGLFRRNQDLIEANKEYLKGMTSASVEMTKLRNSIDLAKKGVISKEEALREFNSTLGQTTGETNDLNEAERLLVANAETYVKIQGLKAKANLLLQKAAEAAADAEIIRLGIEKGGGAGGTIGGRVDELLARSEKRAKDLEGLVDGINQQISALQGTVQKSIGGDIGSAGKVTPQRVKDAEEEYFFVEGTIKDKNQLELDGLQESLRNRFNATEQARQLQAKQFSDTEFYQMAQVKLEENTAAARLAIAENEYQQKQLFWQSTASALGALGDLIGKQTAAGKVFAIAEATINTYLAATSILRNTAKTPAGGIPGFAIAQMIATIVAGLATVRNIIKTPIPGRGSGGGSIPNSTSVEAPIQPQSARSTNTRLDADQINQIGNATVRAFVVESDVTNNQQRIRRLNRQARL